ncbi:MAG: ABC transporter ATP-binding protein [Treponemataceae bacterium]|nr:ABC transporter ATP-binding protein [Treponemataceae bacterium]
MSKTVVEIKGLEKTFSGPASNLCILKDLDMTVSEGSKVVVEGASGSGKSTLLNIIGGLENATKGSVRVGDYNLSGLSEKDLSEYRAKYLGLIFQFHYLLKDFTALENVYLPAYMQGMKKKDAMEKARMLLCDVGLENRLDHLPSQLSGGERQRAAVARSLINDPKLILADEPTGNLDPENARLISDLLFSMVDKYRKTLILVTHDSSLASRGDSCCHIQDGKLIYNAG